MLLPDFAAILVLVELLVLQPQPLSGLVHVDARLLFVVLIVLVAASNGPLDKRPLLHRLKEQEDIYSLHLMRWHI